MKHRYDISSNEDGSVLVIAMLVLVLLTLIGQSATTTSSIEMRIAGNEKAYKESLYRSEAGVRAATQELMDETDSPLLNDLVNTPYRNWLHYDLPDPDEANIAQSDTNWDPANNNSGQILDANNRYIGEYVRPIGDLDMNNERLHEFAIWGRSERNQERVLLKIGVRKRY
ncbi:MAG: pilus assembly PilX N-terminal domain-containing protein [Thermodesulfobacteriota bacterium]|nr:pilus assembly PilX N-terminal domain-containing protein [Thermodesulfobacteriota bacterium]